MMKLPVCPHCNTIYRYGDVKNLIYKKGETCYHCKKNFKVRKIKILILFLIIALITAIFDFFELYVMTGTSFLTLMITNIIALTIGVLLIPFFVRFEKTDTKTKRK